MLAHGETLTTENYLTRMQEVMASLESSQGKLATSEVDRIEERFPQELKVLDVQGAEVEVDRASLLRWLDEAKQNPEGRKRLLDHLRALVEQLSKQDDPLPFGSEAWGERRALLDEVYRAREFRNLKERKPPWWWEKIQTLFENLGRWLEDHLPALGSIQGSWVQKLFYVVVLVMGAVLLVWIVRAFGVAGWRKRSPALTARRAGPPRERDWTSWRREAGRRAQEGEYREAIRCLFVSLLLEGHQRGWWVYEPQATNREHMHRLAGGSVRQEAFRRMMEMYEWAWYGLGRPNDENYRACVAWVKRMEETA
jgi:hypothetical protein